MQGPKLLIEARPFCAFDSSPMNQLEEAGFDSVDMRGKGIGDDDFMNALKEAEAILCGNDLRIDDSLLEKAPRVRAVAKMGAGLDTVDIGAATRRGIIVFHTPGANNQAVADHTFALILAVARRILFCDRSLREGRWEHTRIMGLEIWQKTLGLIGLGAIGRCVALRAKGFDMEVIAHDPYWPGDFAREHGIKRAPLEMIYKESDIISLHVPLTEESRGMINRDVIRLMKPSAILINAARGGVVDEEDLYDALREGVIAGAGIDVFEKEPPLDSPLLTLENVVVTPHTAAFTYEGMNNMSFGIVEQLIEWKEGNKPRFTVNPEVFNKG